MRFFWLLFICSVFSNQVSATTVLQTIYINRGEIEAVDSSLFAYLAYNHTSTFHGNSVLIRLSVNDSLVLSVINNDSINHTFSCQSQSISQNPILSGDTATFKLWFNSPGSFIYYDSDPSMKYLGLGGMVSVEEFSKPYFFWNVKEHNKKWNDTIAKGFSVNWSNYYPDYFLINGNSNPDINLDPVARVVGNVGDTLYISMSNTGRSIHSLHFHGYHATIIYSSKFPQHQGREKDTFPLYPMESLVLRIVPDKPGEFPVHDHNLVAVSGGNYYPNGMFLTLLIQ